ncbi:hypothetical protein [Streptomyces asiaticus]|uniref:hypothetical protein n=1 Tax=Streptomyces asiaticus TaxID=114695 RepID=UPI001FE7D679|nr:hypothetical protein [Streptomyces asiaticus]
MAARRSGWPGRTWFALLSFGSAGADDGPARLATGSGRPGDGLLPQLLHLSGEGVPGLVGGAQVVVEGLHGEDDPCDHRAKQQRTRDGERVAAAPPPLLFA